MSDPTQRCPRCQQDKPLEAFPPSKRGRRGHYCTECEREYRRAWKAKRNPPKPVRRCATEGCSTRVRAKGGQCAPCRKPKRVPEPRGITSYTGMHLRIRYARGKATAYSCVQCNGPAQEWSYDHADPDEVMGDNNGKMLPYSL